MKKASDLANIAACLLEKEEVEWCQGSLARCTNEDPNKLGSVCAMGALQVAALGTLKVDEMSQMDPPTISALANANGMLLRVLRQKWGYLTNIPAWNDGHFSASKANLIDALKETAKQLEAQGR